MAIKKTIHCCQLMEKFLADPRVEIYYYAYSRGYYISNEKLIKYCPFCGCKLPIYLKTKWFKILKNDYNLHDPYNEEQANKIPKEFYSDEWWKNRKL